MRGFRKERTISKPVKVGGSETFTLVGKAAMQVTVQANTDKDGRVTLTIKPPNQGEITYACCCGKYFPVITRHVTPDGERLIIAVMAKPCVKK